MQIFATCTVHKRHVTQIWKQESVIYKYKQHNSHLHFNIVNIHCACFGYNKRISELLLSQYTILCRCKPVGFMPLKVLDCYFRGLVCDFKAIGSLSVDWTHCVQKLTFEWSKLPFQIASSNCLLVLVPSVLWWLLIGQILTGKLFLMMITDRDHQRVWGHLALRTSMC